ncbi:somatostatin-1-like [Amia ocellicauda]|uniref:somatostatin-1-like n=1 Tax=Amia ocellicauda TaxID=2972642 RepID=UPI003464837B
MLSCRAQCALALFGLVFAFCSVDAVTQSDLRLRKFLQRARAAGIAPQDAARYAMEEFVSELAQPDNEVLENEISTGDEKDKVRLELERSTGGNELPPRERKAGCFFWKTISTC